MRSEVSAEIDRLVNQIHTIAEIDRIFLFGSYAYGKPTADSDIDLCVITSGNTVCKRDLMKAMRKSISTVATMPVDLLLYNKDDFYDRAGVNSAMEHKIATEGVSVYGK